MALFGKPRERDVVTLAIESTDLRYLSTKGGRVDKWGSVPLPEGLVSGGMITNAVEMGSILDEMVEACGLDRKHVITSLSGLRSIPRLLILPRLQGSVLEETISREARKEMPVSLEDLYLSWYSMPGGGEQQQIYLLGVPRELIDAQVRALEAAGIPPYVMDLKPLALVRAVKQEEAIIVNLEQDMLDIILVVDCWPAIMRTFSLGKEQLDTQGRLDRLLNELTQTVRFYNDSHRGAPIQPITSIYVTGSLLNSREAVNYVKNVINRPVERPPAPIPCPMEMPTPDYMTNLGLALKKV